MDYLLNDEESDNDLARKILFFLIDYIIILYLKIINIYKICGKI